METTGGMCLGSLEVGPGKGGAGGPLRSYHI